jgi:acetoacetate decarboxylase
MVLKGNYNGYTIPLNAPLYPSPPWLYKKVEALIAVVLFESKTLEPLVPKDVELPGDKVMGALWIAKYPLTTLGPYNEALIAFQVTTSKGMAYYIPYIYVTNDAALAAGREVAGAPKKIGDINIIYENETLRGYVKRGSMSMEVEVKPEYKVDESFIYGLLPKEGVPLLSLRVIPKVGSKKARAEEVYWYAKMNFERDAEGHVFALGGPARVKLVGSLEDPIDEIKVSEILQGIYLRFDMELGVYDVISEFEL